MCILFVHSCGPSIKGYKLILASNRDESFHRPAESANFWKEDETVIGGRDMEKGREGGTWLAACPTRRRLAILLNLSGMPIPTNAKGRGPLVPNFVLGNETAEDYASSIQQTSHEYGAFNLVMVHILKDSSEINFYSNFDKKLTQCDGAIAFDNSRLDRPLQKTVAGLDKFKEIIDDNMNNNRTKDSLISELLSLLKCKTLYLPDPVIENRKPFNHDGLSSIFVNIPEANYGTRTHTIILVDDDDNMDFLEWTMVLGQTEWMITHLKQKLK